MNSKILLIIGGILAAVAPFLPIATVLGMNITIYNTDPNVAYFYIGMGVLIAVMGILNKKWSAAVGLLLGLCVAGLGVKYYMDESSLGATIGYGLYVLLGGGLLAAIGGIMGLMRKTTSVA